MSETNKCKTAKNRNISFQRDDNVDISKSAHFLPLMRHESDGDKDEGLLFHQPVATINTDEAMLSFMNANQTEMSVLTGFI
jgi:hypothetical protein